MGSGIALCLMSSISMDSIVYCRKFWGSAPFLAVENHGGGALIPFVERTGFFWWMIEVLVLLRWVHLFSTRTDDAAIEMPNSKRSAGLWGWRIYLRERRACFPTIKCSVLRS
jgi:hypothetical protein